MTFLAPLQHLLLECLTSLAAVTGGSLGAAILLATLSFRMALLPLNLAVAQRSRARRVALEALEPELDALRIQHAHDSLALAAAIDRLHRDKGVPSVGPLSFVSLVIQAPLGWGLFAALRSGLDAGRRFLWIADLGRPDLALVVLTAALGGIAGALNPDLASMARLVAALASMVMAGVMLSHLSSGIALSWAASNAVGALQMGLLRRSGRRSP
jgi:YidC/Oxa1 family membrane protein insertase